jgi:hypothetical protein
MGDAIDHEAAGATDAFSAVVLKSHRLFAVFNQILVKNVDDRELRHLRIFDINRVADELARFLTILLAPDF